MSQQQTQLYAKTFSTDSAAERLEKRLPLTSEAQTYQLPESGYRVEAYLTARQAARFKMLRIKHYQNTGHKVERDSKPKLIETVPSIDTKISEIVKLAKQSIVGVEGFADDTDDEIWNYVDVNDCQIAIAKLREISQLAQDAAHRIAAKMIERFAADELN